MRIKTKKLKRTGTRQYEFIQPIYYTLGWFMTFIVVLFLYFNPFLEVYSFRKHFNECNVAQHLHHVSEKEFVYCITLLASKKRVQNSAYVHKCNMQPLEKNVFLAELFCKMNKLMKKNSQFPIIPVKLFFVCANIFYIWVFLFRFSHML